MKRGKYAFIASSTYDRADVLMSAGCSTFVSAALILVMPRVGVILLEMLLGMFLIGCALVARARVRRRALGKDGPKKSSDAKAKWFDRYDVLMILAVIVIQTAAAGLLRKAGWSEGTVSILPLIMFAAGILLKPRVVEFVGRRRKTQPADADRRDTAFSRGTSIQPIGSRPGVSEISKERKETSDVSQRNRNDCRVEGSSAASRQWKNDARGCGLQSDSIEGYDDTTPAGSTGCKKAEKNASSWPAEAATETSRRSAASVLPKPKPSLMRFAKE